MDETKRQEMVTNCARRLVKNLESMSAYDKQMYMEKLVTQLDDLRLIALNFAVEMTPERKGTNNAE